MYDIKLISLVTSTGKENGITHGLLIVVCNIIMFGDVCADWVDLN